MVCLEGSTPADQVPGENAWYEAGGTIITRRFWANARLNYHTVVTKAIYNASLWLNLGVDGFRVDAAATSLKKV